MSREPRLDPTGVRPTAIVAAVIALLFFGSQIVNAVIPDPGPGIEPGGGVTVGRIRLQLAEGWRVSDEVTGTRLAKGSVAVDILSAGFDGEASALYELFMAEALAPDATGFQSTEPSLVVVGPGIPAARGAYTGIFGEAGEVEGQITALVVDGEGYVFDAWSHVGGLGRLLPEAELMIQGVEVLP